LVGVGCNVGDEFLGCESEEALEGEGRGVRWEAGEEEVVGCYCVGDLEIEKNQRSVHFSRIRAKMRIQ